MQVSKYLQAPKSKSPLEYIDGNVVSTQDEYESYHVRNGVVNFDASTAENEKIKGDLNQLFVAANDTNCLKAIEELSNSSDYLINEDRRRYIDLTGIGTSDIVLEVGASMGQHTRFIAQRCNHLEALEVVPEQAAFAKLWCEQSGQSNVNVSTGGVEGILPYRTNSFDFLIINYVLEWSAGRSSLKPSDYHFQLLSECLRVLKPGGSIFLSTKNRYNIQLLLGGKDEHLGFRFGSALPRWLGSCLSALIKTDNPSGYLYSRNAIERLFTRVGFTQLAPFLFLPDARAPKITESFNKAGVERIGQSSYWNKASKKERLFSLLPFSIQRNIAPSHVYMAVKPRIS